MNFATIMSIILLSTGTYTNNGDIITQGTIWLTAGIIIRELKDNNGQ